MFSEVPEGWVTKSLKDLATFQSGYAFKSEKFVDDTSVGMPVIRIRDLIKQSPSKHYNGDIPSEYIVKRDDILIGMDGEFNCVKWQSRDGALNQRLLRVYETEDTSKEYLLYRLQPILKELENTISGTTVKHLSVKDLNRLFIATPPLNEQHRIAEILSSVDASIQATQAVIDQAERVKRGLMEELLTGGLGSEAIERGEVPEGWSSSNLSAFVKNITKKWNERDAMPYVGLEHIEQNTGRLLAFGSSDNISSAKNVFESGDVLFGKLRPNLRKYWKADRSGICSTDILVLKCQRGLIEDFLFAIVQSEPFLSFAENDAAGTKMPRTSWKRLETIECAIPPLNEQHRIAEIFSSADDFIVKQKAILEQQTRLKKGLMDDLLTGKVRTI